ncbi:MOSC N-terminal beta barrel domain-containing protein [Actinomadura sp. DC4]|uniref:MOSC domain-containing protein n=1 Tax=Actinomadura sp. DC4 TaxID=3055069 RepID=UPI0025AF216B|nr:MOSC N-terminal beta barrel domain-containing protein [Actinomadura sp. DC4]MDN3353109.1 MOSC domain-containing protein [Actinomadura sp. DC4]
MTAVVRLLNVYPLKSAGGTRLMSAEVTPTGFRHDREFMLVRPDGARLSQREVPRMALLRPSYDGGTLVVDAPGAVAPLVHEGRTEGTPREVRLPAGTCLGLDQGDEAAGWFGALLDVDCRLMRFTGRRETARGGGTLTFADGYPLLVISAESLEDLNARLKSPLPMDRFRPNIVIEGLGPYGEDSVDLLRIGDMEIELVKPCGRCVITTTDQNSAVRGREPLRTLATYRTRRTDDGSRAVIFGQNGIPRTVGTIRAGDRVCATTRRSHP